MEANAKSSFTIGIVCNFNKVKNELRLTIPTYFAPRYDINPQTGVIDKSTSIIKFTFEFEFNSNYKIQQISTTDSSASIEIKDFSFYDRIFVNSTALIKVE